MPPSLSAMGPAKQKRPPEERPAAPTTKSRRHWRAAARRVRKSNVMKCTQPRQSKLRPRCARRKSKMHGSDAETKVLLLVGHRRHPNFGDRTAADHGHAHGDVRNYRLSAHQSSYELFGCKLGLGLGLVVIWRHDTTHLAPDDILRARLGRNGRAPVPWFALIGDYRKLRIASHGRLGRQARTS